MVGLNLIESRLACISISSHLALTMSCKLRTLSVSLMVGSGFTSSYAMSHGSFGSKVGFSSLTSAPFVAGALALPFTCCASLASSNFFCNHSYSLLQMYLILIIELSQSSLTSVMPTVDSCNTVAESCTVLSDINLTLIDLVELGASYPTLGKNVMHSCLLPARSFGHVNLSQPFELFTIVKETLFSLLTQQSPRSKVSSEFSGKSSNKISSSNAIPVRSIGMFSNGFIKVFTFSS